MSRIYLPDPTEKSSQVKLTVIDRAEKKFFH